MKKTIQWLAAAAAAAFLMAGCGSPAPSDETLKSEAGEMVGDYMSRTRDDAQSKLKAGDLKPLQEVLPGEDLEAAAELEEETDVLTAIESLSPEGQRKGADYLYERLPAADMYSLDGLSDAEKILVFQNTFTWVGFMDDSHVQEASEVGPEDVFLEDGGGEPRARVMAGASIGDLYLVWIDGEWKIDGPRMLEMWTEETGK